jgi:hypothetical protein
VPCGSHRLKAFGDSVRIDVASQPPNIKHKLLADIIIVGKTCNARLGGQTVQAPRT